MRTCKIGSTTRQRREKWPRKERRAKHLLVSIARVQVECEEVAKVGTKKSKARWAERAATWKQREIKVQLWLHWEEGGFLQAKALLAAEEKKGQQDFFPLLSSC